MIPKNIIQFWHDKDCMPEILAQAMAVTLSNNNDFKFIIADDQFMHRLLAEKYGSAVLRLYQMNRIPASRADISRLILLYEYGGFYLDTSMELLGSLNKYLDDVSDVILIKRDDAERHQVHPEKAHVINGIIGAAPQSDFIQWCIHRVIRNMVTGENNKKVNISTGPNIINQALVEFEHRLNIKKISFKEMRDGFLIYRRASGFSNSWTVLQRDGIIDYKFYADNTYHHEKLWIFQNRIFYLSFAFLSINKNRKSNKIWFFLRHLSSNASRGIKSIFNRT